MSYFLPPLTPMDVTAPHMIDDRPLRTIRGTPVLVNYMVDEYSAMKSPLPDTEIKMRLCNQVAEELFKQNVIEFTREVTPMGNIHYRARLFAVPNTDVQLLREMNIIK